MQSVLVAGPQDSPRIDFGIERLAAALEETGLRWLRVDPDWTMATYRESAAMKIYVGVRGESQFLEALEEADVLDFNSQVPEGEGFYVATCPGNLWVVVGGSETGALYGCQALARMVLDEGRLPLDVARFESPAFALRGPALGLQKTKIEPPRQTYEYPITPDRFPWFYDKAMWTAYLDELFELRCNVVYIWSGHPFSSLVKLEDYPEALEVTEEEFQLNVELFHWLTEEAQKRGIWVVLKFYNIHIPLPFARKHGLALHQPKPLPLTSDYTRKSIAAFIRSFPNVGLMICLGEALQGHMYGVEWFRDTIIAGINDGLRDLDLKEKPPVILRAHAINAEEVIGEAIEHYPNLYTMAKYNGESLTTWLPRGKWQDRHQHLSSLKSIHIINVHILANLEPFRFGAPSFIQKSMLAAKHRLRANGLHLYPLFYWDWPHSPDQTEPRLLQLERDWIWFAAWFRYAWNPERDAETEKLYWIEELARRFGDRGAAKRVLEAYEATGECAPRLLRRFGITEGNRQTLSLGMTLSQLTNPDRYRAYEDLWESHAPRGERLAEYADKAARGEVHVGETPMDVVESAEAYADIALKAVEEADALVTDGREEFERFKNDVRAIHAMVRFYGCKVRAAIGVLTYKHRSNGDWLQAVDHLEEARSHLKESLDWYRRLTELTDGAYLYANSLLTRHRKIPFPDGEAYSHWRDCLPLYEEEFERFSANVARLKAGALPEALRELTATIDPWRSAEFELLSANAETYAVEKGCFVFTDTDLAAGRVAEELVGLTGIRFSQAEAANEGVAFDIELKEPSKILIGYFRSKAPGWLPAPDLEVNAHADDRGGSTAILRNAISLFSYPAVNVHAPRYEAGRHRIHLGQGAYAVLGVVPADQPMEPRDATAKERAEAMDWLYE